jgi:hypothetical protein
MTIDKIQITGEYKHLSVRSIKEDGSFHRVAIQCGDFDKAEALGVKAEAEQVWTAEVLEAWNNRE